MLPKFVSFSSLFVELAFLFPQENYLFLQLFYHVVSQTQLALICICPSCLMFSVQLIFITLSFYTFYLNSLPSPILSFTFSNSLLSTFPNFYSNSLLSTFSNSLLQLFTVHFFQFFILHFFQLFTVHFFQLFTLHLFQLFTLHFFQFFTPTLSCTFYFIFVNCFNLKLLFIIS